MYTGLTLEELGDLAKSIGLSHTIHYSTDIDLKQFREILKDNLLSPENYLLLNYQRKDVNQVGMGHISPVSAYYEKKDMVLVMDVASYKYPPVWIPIDTLFKATLDIDNSSGKSRGLIEINLQWRELVPINADTRFYLRFAFSERFEAEPKFAYLECSV